MKAVTVDPKAEREVLSMSHLSIAKPRQLLPVPVSNNIVCIGGGHGLGRLLSSLVAPGVKLTGIVTTTDNGGSTGRLRQAEDTIAWGDLRHCLS